MFDPISLIGMAAGIGLQLFGSDEAASAQEDAAAAAAASAAKANKFINKKIIPNLQAQGVAQKNASKESLKAERLRRQQMEIDATRTQRDIVRNAVLARSMSLTNAVSQGGQGGIEGSGFLGSIAQINAEQNRQSTGVFLNRSIGRGIFKANIASTKFTSQANMLATRENILRSQLGTMTNQSEADAQAIAASGASGAGYAQLGSTIVSNLPQITKLGTSMLFGSSAPWYT